MELVEVKDTLKKKTEQFALDVIVYFGSIPENVVGRVIKNQFVKAGTSVGANYRAVLRAKSNADFINKLKIVEEEADESLGCLELLTESCLVKMTEEVKWLMKEASELVAIMVATLKTARKNSGKGKKK